MNIVNLVKDQLGGQLINQIGGMLGENGSNTTRAVEGAIPSILGGLMNSAGTSEGASRLNQALDDQDDSILDNLGGLLGGGGHTEVANRGSSILGSLLGGNMLGSLAGALSGFSGIGRGSTGSLIGMLAPIVLSVLRRQRNSQGLDAGGLASFLGGQRDNIAAAMPTGLNDHLSREGLGDSLMGSLRGGASAVGDTAHRAAGAVGDAGRAGVNTATAAGGAAVAGAGAAAASGGGLLRKIIPLLILALIAWFLWKMFAGGAAEKAMDTVKETGSSAVTAVKETGESAAGAVSGMAGGDVAGTLGGVFDGATESISGITDVASAEAAVPQLEDMTGKVSGLSSAFGALPADAKSTVTGLIGEKMPMLEGAVAKASEIPGVGDKIGPVIEKLMGAIGGLQ